MKFSLTPVTRVLLFSILGAALSPPDLHAQTTTQALSLGNGWASVWLEVEPRYTVGDSVLNDPADGADDETLAAGDRRLGQPKAPQDVFTNPAITVVVTPKPLAGLADFFAADPDAGGAIGTFNQAEWHQWRRSDPAGSNNLAAVQGNRPYLLKVEGAVPSPFSLPVTGVVRFFRPEWTPDRYNLLGFGIDGAPTFQSFFGPAGSTHQVGRIFRLTSAGNWVTVTPNAAMKGGEAYWIYCRGTSNYMGPVAVDFDGSFAGALNFGGPADAVAVGTGVDQKNLDIEELIITNLDQTAHTPALELFANNDPPLPAPSPDDLELYAVRPTPGSLGWEQVGRIDSDPAAGSTDLQEVVGGNTTAVLSIGARRIWTFGQVGRTNLYRLLTGAGSAFWLPVRARNNSLQPATDLLPESDLAAVAGLWIGEVVVNAVSSIVEDGAPVRPVAASAPIRLILHSDAAGTVRLLEGVTIMQTRTADPSVRPVPVLVVDPARLPFYEGIRERNGKRVGLRAESVAYSLPRKIDATTQAALLNDPAFPGLTGAEDIPDFLAAASLRPPSLKEAYHLSWPLEGSLGAGKTVHTFADKPLRLDPFHRSNPYRHTFHRKHPRGPVITRDLELVFEAGTPGSDRLSGTYRETLKGAIKSNLVLTGSIQLERVSSVAELVGAE